MNAHITATTLDDFISEDLLCLSIGLNPSIPSVKAGYYFANPRNRFWSALNAANILPETLDRSLSSQQRLHTEYRIGFTDVVKRPSRMGHELRAADFRRDAPLLREKIEHYQPMLLWFHGKIAVTKFFTYAYGLKRDWDWGLCSVPELAVPVLITPNPSPANAAYSLQDISEQYQALAPFLVER